MNQIDPKAEMMRSWSPYAYCFDNPVKFVDPTGMEGEDPTDPPHKKRVRKFIEKLEDKVFTILKKMHDGGANLNTLQAKANELADKYQNKNWFRFFAKDRDHKGGLNHIKNEGASRSGKTGTNVKEHISIEVTQQETKTHPFSGKKDPNDPNTMVNNKDYNTGLVIDKGGSVKVEFKPLGIPDGLVVIGVRENGQQQVLINIPEQASSEFIVQGSSTNRGEPMTIIIRAVHGESASDGGTAWFLNINVTNPKFELNPYKSIKSNISY
jgi:hypothetical protein